MKTTSKILIGGLAAVGALVGAEAALNAFLSRRGGPMRPALPGAPGSYNWRGLANIWYTVQGEGPPVVLLHGIGAGASSFEWRQNFDELSKQFQVYALDWPGFGLSDRPDLHYSGRLYVQVIDDFVRQVVQRPANVVASSHAAAYAIRLAHSRPERIKSLAVICPVGLFDPKNHQPPLEWGARILEKPIIGESAYYVLASRSNIARTLRDDLYFDPGLVTDSVIDTYYTAAHQPGAPRAIEAFLRGDLDLSIQTEFPALKQPVLMAWGAESTYTPVSHARRYQEANGNAVLHIFQSTRQLPHDEKHEEFNRLIVSWLLPHTNDQALRLIS